MGENTNIWDVGINDAFDNQGKRRASLENEIQALEEEISQLEQQGKTQDAEAKKIVRNMRLQDLEELLNFVDKK